MQVQAINLMSEKWVLNLLTFNGLSILVGFFLFVCFLGKSWWECGGKFETLVAFDGKRRF